MNVREKLFSGLVIPAHPLALTAERKLDERRQHALTRYYLAAGAGGIAVGVHTTQFAIRDPNFPTEKLTGQRRDRFLRRRIFSHMLIRRSSTCGSTPRCGRWH